MKRRGVAMLAALWLVVIIAAVALQFALTAKERRSLGLQAADRARDRGAMVGALASMQARLEYELRNRGARANAVSLRAYDPWLDIDSLYSGTITVGDTEVDVIASDLGSTVSINAISENELRQLFGFVLRDATRADALAQSIMDWRDLDDLPRVSGAEREEYLRDGRLVLPSNSAFRSVDDLIHVAGMTPEVLALVRPYFNAYMFRTRINVNAAPEAVLRTIPGVTDAVIGNILQQRAAGQRIQTINSIVSAAERASTPVGRRGSSRRRSAQSAMQRQLSSRATVDARDVQLRFVTRPAGNEQPSQLYAVLRRGANGTAVLRWQQW